ncbi:MAG: leucyl aminopeptidase [Rickettsiales bacterium]|nr:leucyl aminopeptidase [Rickettsiales bacterium]
MIKIWLVFNNINKFSVKIAKKIKVVEKEKKFPKDYISIIDGEIFIFLNDLSKFTQLEFNYNLIWVGTRIYGFCKSGKYVIKNLEDIPSNENLYLGWLLGSYNFEDYKSQKHLKKRVYLDNFKDKKIEITAESIFLVRDLINIPANDLGPLDIQKFIKDNFKKFKLKIIEWKGKSLKKNFPLIYSVGRGAEKKKQPIFSEFHWSSKNKKKKKNIVLVGKGVCFDTGGLNIKTGNGMILMKKDMGGAANCIGLAKMLMKSNLDINLKVFLGLVENSVSSKSMRPSDIIKSRKKTFVEIRDTDAEGRLVLADALSFASELNPDLIIDMATLTGSSRVALGTEVPSFFSNNEQIANLLIRFSNETGDPLWQLPLWKNYLNLLESEHADTSNIGKGIYAGAITAALFLQKFVDSQIPWIHIDMMAWSSNKSLTSYYGGEAMSIRCLFELIKYISKN